MKYSYEGRVMKMLKLVLVGAAILICFLNICLAGPIHDAADKGDLGTIKKLGSESAVLVNEKDSEGWTPLHYAAARGNLEIVKYLLSQGADINAKENMEYTPLINAVATSHYDVVRCLVEHGADLNIKVCVGKIFKNQIKEDNSVERTIAGEDYDTALDFALKENNAEIAGYLKSKGAGSAE